VWKRYIFSKNLRLTEPFFKKAGVKQPKYSNVFRNMLHDVFDFIFRYPPKKNMNFEIDENSISILEEMRRGGIFLTAHYGNHEFLGYRLAELGLPLRAAAQEQKPEFFDKWLQKRRTFNGKNFAEKIETKHLLEFIDNKGLFAMLADQDFRKPIPRSIEEECKSEFLGLKVRCNPLPAFILEHRSNTPVFCGHLRQVCNTQTLFLKKIHAKNFYTHYHLWLENLILENPAKWYGWFHNRFRTRCRCHAR
jgi:KDO2-lipid IV(A) lauroyltransferase